MWKGKVKNRSGADRTRHDLELGRGEEIGIGAEHRRLGCGKGRKLAEWDVNRLRGNGTGPSGNGNVVISPGEGLRRAGGEQCGTEDEANRKELRTRIERH
jgi:hypothetical protein